MHHKHKFKQKPNTPLFAEAGMIPGGECWVVPTDAFLKLWESPMGDDLRKRGFRMRNDGTRVGASQDCIVAFTAARLEVNR